MKGKPSLPIAAPAQLTVLGLGPNDFGLLLNTGPGAKRDVVSRLSLVLPQSLLSGPNVALPIVVSGTFEPGDGVDVDQGWRKATSTFDPELVVLHEFLLWKAGLGVEDDGDLPCLVPKLYTSTGRSRNQRTRVENTRRSKVAVVLVVLSLLRDALVQVIAGARRAEIVGVGDAFDGVVEILLGPGVADERSLALEVDLGARLGELNQRLVRRLGEGALASLGAKALVRGASADRNAIIVAVGIVGFVFVGGGGGGRKVRETLIE